LKVKTKDFLVKMYLCYIKKMQTKGLKVTKRLPKITHKFKKKRMHQKKQQTT